MSEYQYVAFRAIDAPVSEKNLAFMRRQSTRAEITAWDFENEYHFGDFHGDALEMLRRGYDFHLHYANFGTRTLMVRLPGGWPDAKAAGAYFEGDSLDFVKDKQGPGGILRVEPYFEADQFEEELEPGELFERLLPLRGEIQDGDLRPLYLAQLAVLSDGNHDPTDEREGPVPAGLDALTSAQRALAEFYGLSEALIAAAGRNCPPKPKSEDLEKAHSQWLKRQPEEIKVAWLRELMADAGAAVRSKILAQFQADRDLSSWPVVSLGRTIGDIQVAADEIQREQDRERAQETARKRAAKLSRMRENPTPTLQKAEELVKEKSLDAYHQVAKLLAGLREALCGTDRSGLAEQHARKLKEGYPTLKNLTAELRREGFLRK